MVERDELDEACKFLDQSVDSIDMPAWAGRPTMTRLVVPVYGKAAFGEIHRHLVISAGVFGESVNEHHHAGRLGRQP